MQGVAMDPVAADESGAINVKKLGVCVHRGEAGSFYCVCAQLESVHDLLAVAEAKARSQFL
jgi:hypothetical protein